MANIPVMILLIRVAIVDRRQLSFVSAGKWREMCPHVLGTRQGVWHVYGWQFAGETNRGRLPDWRCIELLSITSEIRMSDGEWHRGWRAKNAMQTCVDSIFAQVDPAFGPLPPSTSPLRIRAPALSLTAPKRR
jgi:hypothetical protein